MTNISKNVYFDVLDDIVNKYNNTVHRSIKMKPIDVTDDSYAEYNEDSNKKNPKFKVGDHVRISKYKNVFAKEYTQNWSEEVFVSKIPWTYVISDLNGELITESFYEKELQKYLKEKVKKVLKRKDNCMSNGKGMIIHLIVALRKKTLKTDLTNITYIDASSFALKTNLTSLKTEVAKLDIDKLAPVPVDLSKVSNVVKIDVVKKLFMTNWLLK